MFGLTRETFDRTIAAFNRAVLPEDAERVAHAIERAIETLGVYEAEFRIALPHGGTRWVQARGQAVTDESGTAVRLIGVAYDTTAVHDGEVRTSRVLEAMPTGYLSMDHEWRFTVVNSAAERLLGHAGSNCWVAPCSRRSRTRRAGRSSGPTGPRSTAGSRRPSRPTTRRPSPPGTTCCAGPPRTGCRCSSPTSPSGP